jgi:iron complex outermembrane receptor protein
MDNANLLKAAGTTLFNLNLHYDPPADHGWLSRVHFYYDIQNLASRTYIASANNISDSLNAATGMENGEGVLINNTGSIWAGVPRANFGGFRVKF